MARSIWSGTISFGLVNIPIKLYTAVRDTTIHFHMLSKDGTCRLRRKLVCPETGEEFDYRDTARGYEIAPDQYVLVSDEELAGLKPEAARTIEITDFVDLEQIDPVYFDKTYYVGPDERGAKAYRLLMEAMDESGKVGIAKFVMRAKEYLAAVRPGQGVLCLNTMWFDEEVVKAADVVDLPPAKEVAKKEVQVARQLIEALSGDFKPGKYKDDYRQRVQELIDRKAAGEEIVVQEPEEEEPPRVINLMKALEESLAQAKGGAGGGGAGRKAAPRGGRGGGRAEGAGKRGAAARRSAPAPRTARRKSA